MRAVMLAASVTTFTVVITGCMTTSPVVPMGKDSYLVTVDTRGGVSGGAAKAAQTANDYCAKKDLLMMVRRTDRSGFNIGTVPVTNELIFSCVAADDPEYKRPDMRRDPTTVIEDARNQ